MTFGAAAFEGRPPIKDLGPQLVPILETLEDLGMDFVSLDFSDLSSGMSLMRPRERSVYASLAQLSVYRAMTTGSEHPPGLYLVEASADVAAQGSYTHQTIELALLAGRFQRERVRLRRSVTPERHLFIWLSATLYDARKGLASSDRPPNEAPTLPDDITTLWVAALSQPDRLVTWRSSGGPWERFDVP